MGQMDLFGFPKNKREVESLPPCGSVGCQEVAKYYAPSKHGIWVNMCEECSRELATASFHTGYELVKLIKPQIIFDAVELTPVSTLVTQGRDRIIRCAACSTRKTVGMEFSGQIECVGCTIFLRVMKLFPSQGPR